MASLYLTRASGICLQRSSVRFVTATSLATMRISSLESMMTGGRTLQQSSAQADKFAVERRPTP